MASKSKYVSATNNSKAPKSGTDDKAPGKPGKSSKSAEPTVAPVKKASKVTTTKGGKVTVPSATAPEPSGKRKATVATAANTASAPPKKGKGKAPAPETTAPPKKGKASAAPTAPPALREVKWTDERITVFRVMRRMKATSAARARTAEAIAIEAEVTPFRVKEMGYGGNVTRGVLGKDASPFRLHGLIAVADASQVAADYAAGGRGLCYYLTEKGCAVVLPGDKAPRSKK